MESVDANLRGGDMETRRGTRLLDVRLSEFCWFFLINGLLFESFLTKYFSVAGYLDEVATVLLAICAAFVSIGDRFSKSTMLSIWERAGVGFLIAFVCIVLLSGYISAVQPNLKPVFIDVFACIKFPVALLSGFVVFQSADDLYALLLCETKVLLFIMLPFALLNQFVNMNMRFDIRYGIYSFQFIFGHPASLAAVIVGCISLLLADVKPNTPWLLLCWLYLVLSLRSTAIAFAAFSFLVWFFSKKRGRVTPVQVFLFTLVALYFGWSQVKYYFVEVDGSARRKLLDVGIEVANRYFPLGSGFATYGSNITGQREYYSPLYTQYGLSGIFGLTVENSNFLSDSFWPIVFGQFGWIGSAFYVIAIAFIAFGSIGRVRAKGASMLPLFLAFGYLLLTSLSSSAFFHPMSLYIAVCASLAACHQISRVYSANSVHLFGLTAR